ncbi:RNA methyltransferase [Mycolicibacterium fortuitum]|uniref:RNA methyltransferase n=1 Tax=Mycolicibacterium fortuitum TaxID=1766 RepID=UPI0007E9BBF3|nr:RNA methyltransferase [Mycolicibacterium fortuitum]OBF77054.1 hypothetical protein A5751_23015 [Mycolicibacterium fortuitum]
MSGTRRSSRRSRGFFGVAIWRPKREINVGTLWRSAFLYDAAFCATVGGQRYEKQASDTPGTANHIPLVAYQDIDDLIEHLPQSCELVGVELDDRAVPLTRFHHPMRAVYLLGAEDHGLPPRVLARCHRVVQIPGAQDWSMNVGVAGSIVMYDRFAKTAGAEAAAS